MSGAWLRVRGGSELTGTTVAGIIRREWGPNALWVPSRDRNSPEEGTVVEPTPYDAMRVLAVVLATGGEWGPVPHAPDPRDRGAGGAGGGEPAAQEGRRVTGVELRARREALGLTAERLARMARWQRTRISETEAGRRRAPAHLDGVLAGLEEIVGDLADRAAEAGLAADQAADQAADDAFDGVTLFTYERDEELWAAHPELDGLPAAIHRVAMARARHELAMEDVDAVIASRPGDDPDDGLVW